MKSATRLAASPLAGARWVGKDALRDISRPAVAGRFVAKATEALPKGRTRVKR